MGNCVLLTLRITRSENDDVFMMMMMNKSTLCTNASTVSLLLRMLYAAVV